MTSLTTDQGLILPDTTDGDNVPLVIANLVTGIESRMVKRYASIADRLLRNPTPTEGELSYLIDLDRYDRYTGATWTPLVPSFRPTQATVATSQTTASTSFTDLATSGPAITVTTADAVEVTLTTSMSLTGGNAVLMGFAVSGATTQAAADNKALRMVSTVLQRASATYLVTGLTPGSNTFTAKYRVDAGTGTWVDRNILVRVV